jgi:hypothetical protein
MDVALDHGPTPSLATIADSPASARGLAVQPGEQAGIGSLEDLDLAFDPLGADPRELASRVKKIGELEPAAPASLPPPAGSSGRSASLVS